MVIERRKCERRQGERRRKERGTSDRRHFDRRRLLKFTAGVAVAGLVEHPLLAGASRLLLPSRAISFYNIHTDEKLAVEYCEKGEYCAEALAEINHILRDYRTGEIKPIDPALLDLLYAITRRLKPGGLIHLISGYRSPATNRLLRRTTSGVARHSLHMQGLAADISIPGCELSDLRRVAVSLKGGGVGYYPDSGFIHVDTGRVRYW